MGRLRRTIVGVAAAALLARALAGCGSYGATSHDAVDGAAPPQPPPPPAPSPADGSTSDATPLPDAASSGFCASLTAASSFCADFDESTDPANGWGGLSVGDGGAAALDETVFKSAPRSFHASTADSTYLFKTFGGVTRTFDLELDAFLVYDASTANMGELTPIQIDTGQTNSWIFFFADNGKGYFQQAGTAFSSNFPSPLGDWHHLHATVTLTSMGSTITASVDGTPLWTDHPMSPAWPSPASVSLKVGVPGLAGLPSGAARIDNVVVHAE